MAESNHSPAMSTRIIPFASGINNCYIVKEKGAILVDAGWPGKGPSFKRFMERQGLKPEEIRLIILTHGDFDHVGGAAELREITGAKVAIHKMDRDNLEKGIYHWPGGVTAWGRLTRSIFKPLMRKKADFPPVKADIVLDDQDYSLEEFGVQGKIIHTPGHTYGSVSVMLDNGDALVGCLAHNRFPFVLKPGLPIYSMDIELLKNSWKKVIETGAKTIYPSHGRSFPLEKILKYIH